MAEIDPVTKTLRCVNFAFCLLAAQSKERLTGAPLSSIATEGINCVALLDEVCESRSAVSRAETGRSGGRPVSWTYTLWPVLAAENRVAGVVLQVTEASTSGQDAMVINQALLLGTLRQEELLEAAELLNTQLRAEMDARKAAENALVRSEKLAVAGRMAAVLAHEINNPISAVMDLLYVIQRTDGLPADALRFAEQADGELKRIAHIARQTLGFYRESASTAGFLVKPMLDSILDLLKAKIASTGAIVEMQCDETLRITASHGELRQVFSNLLLNSLEALGDRRRVTLRASLSIDPVAGRRRVRITVADNADGIEPTLLHHLFEPFYTTKGAVGNGLGLWVCNQIVSSHGGSFRVRSSTHDPKRGTTFSVLLPFDRPLEQAVRFTRVPT